MTARHAMIRPFGLPDVPAPTGREAIAFDQVAIEELGVPQPVLMENAGRAVAAVLARLYPTGPVIGFAGVGNNGGDALVALRTLQAWGRDVRAVLVAEPGGARPLLHGWPVPVVWDGRLEEQEWHALFVPGSVVVDGILGTGVRGAPRERQSAVIRRLNESGLAVVAVDVPSGIDADTGAVPGDAVRAHVTVTFGAPKLGCLLHPARALVGRHVAVEIGFPPLGETFAGARVVTPLWAQAQIPRRPTDTHKNAVGRVTIVAGGVGMAGAAVLAARAAFGSGAGLVRVCSAPENREIVQATVPEAIYVDASDAAALAAALQACDAVAAGPGLGTGPFGAAAVSAVADAPGRATVLDADALNLAARADVRLQGWGRPLLLTPHRGEMARLLAGNGGPDAGDPAAMARSAAVRFGCAVLFKGAPSVVATVDGPLLVDTQSSSELAVAGMGDALTGVCVGLMAQGLQPAIAGAVALYLVGRAARIAGRGAALTPSDALRWLPVALAERGGGESDLDLPFVTFDADPAR